jgi:hypothetical protein
MFLAGQAHARHHFIRGWRWPPLSIRPVSHDRAERCGYCTKPAGEAGRIDPAAGSEPDPPARRNRTRGARAITRPYDKTLIAGCLRAQPQSLWRAFNRLEEPGVTIAHSMASIADIETLRHHMQDNRGAPSWKAE